MKRIKARLRMEDKLPDPNGEIIIKGTKDFEEDLLFRIEKILVKNGYEYDSVEEI